MTIVPFLNRVNDLILNPLLLLAFSVAFIYFFYGIVTFLRLDSADKTREEAKSAIFWGIVGMLIMFSVYGIIHFVLATFGIQPSDIDSSGAKDFIRLNR